MVKHLKVHEANSESLRAELVLGTFLNLSSPNHD